MAADTMTTPASLRPLSGKVAVITGSTSGIGLGIARTLAAAGGHVVLNGFGAPDEIERIRSQIATEFGVRAGYAAADMIKPEAIERMIAGILQEFGRIDVLINNAGIAGINKTVWETDLEEWRKVLRINLDGPFICAKAIVPVMLRQGYGRVVNIASIAGKEGNPNA